MKELGMIFILLTGALEIHAADRFKLLLEDRNSKEIISHLEASGIAVSKSSVFAVVRKSEEVMTALVNYLNFLELTIIQTDENIRNSQTTRSASGLVYKRKYIEFNEDYEAVARTDNTTGPSMYAPGHPDADSKGMLALPNVNIGREYTDLKTSKLRHSIVTKAIQRLEPDYVRSEYLQQVEFYDNLLHLTPYNRPAVFPPESPRR